MNLKDERWVCIDGSIWTERGFDWQSPYHRDIKLKDQKVLVLPNAGSLGSYLVLLHNIRVDNVNRARTLTGDNNVQGDRNG